MPVRSIARYTRFVAFSKHSLWMLVALIIAMLVWVASDNTDSGARIVFSSISKTADDLQNVMLSPHYQGVDSSNRPYTIIADKATQIDENTVSMANIRADMGLEGEKWAALNAGSGVLNLKDKQMLLQENVSIFYGEGYEFRTREAHVDIQKSSAYGNTPVEGQGPLGTLKADGFTVSDHGETIRFNGSVRMKLYR